MLAMVTMLAIMAMLAMMAMMAMLACLETLDCPCPEPFCRYNDWTTRVCPL